MTTPQYGSDLVVDLMRAAGIEYVAFNPGATFRGLHDSIVNYGGNRAPEIILCTHEEIAVSVAHGYAKATGRPMATVAHNIVGLQHASMAIFNAFCDRAPILVLGGTGPMDTSKRRPWIDWIHTALVQGTLVRDYVKFDDNRGRFAAVPEAFARAWRIARTEPLGPVYVCLDATVQEERLERAIPLPDLARFEPPAPPQADPQALEDAARRLCEARSPVILVGSLGGKPAASRSLLRLADLLAAPVVDLSDAHQGRPSVPSTYPLAMSAARPSRLSGARPWSASAPSDRSPKRCSPPRCGKRSRRTTGSWRTARPADGRAVSGIGGPNGATAAAAGRGSAMVSAPRSAWPSRIATQDGCASTFSRTAICSTFSAASIPSRTIGCRSSSSRATTARTTTTRSTRSAWPLRGDGRWRTRASGSGSTTPPQTLRKSPRVLESTPKVPSRTPRCSHPP